MPRGNTQLPWSRGSQPAAARRQTPTKVVNEMTQTHEIKAQSRKDEGKGASRRLRRASFVPAIVYGAEQAPESIQIEHNTILLAAKNEWFFSSILDLNVDGKVQKVLVRDWQKHPFKQQMMHMDFLRIDEKPGDIIHLSQVKRPPGVELVAAHGGEGQDIAVVTANMVQEEDEEAPAEDEAAPAAATAPPAAVAPAKKDDKK